MFDPTELSTAPWVWRKTDQHFQQLEHPGPRRHGDEWEPAILWYTTDDDGVHGRPTDEEFIVLARQAFDVMMRRKWTPFFRAGSGWTVVNNDMTDWWDNSHGPHYFPDPFTALVEVDRWYAENVEKKESVL